jgi:hypothetical protein
LEPNDDGDFRYLTTSSGHFEHENAQRCAAGDGAFSKDLGGAIAAVHASAEDDDVEVGVGRRFFERVADVPAHHVERKGGALHVTVIAGCATPPPWSSRFAPTTHGRHGESYPRQRPLPTLHVVWQCESFWQTSPWMPAVHTRVVCVGQWAAAQSALSAQGWPTAPEVQVALPA